MNERTTGRRPEWKGEDGLAAYPIMWRDLKVYRTSGFLGVRGRRHIVERERGSGFAEKGII